MSTDLAATVARLRVGDIVQGTLRNGDHDPVPFGPGAAQPGIGDALCCGPVSLRYDNGSSGNWLASLEIVTPADATVEDLEDAPPGSWCRDSGDCPWEKESDGRWRYAGLGVDSDCRTAAHLIETHGPVRLTALGIEDGGRA